nr:hypothetical protein [Ktedonobacteraceae bacterium]
DLSGRQQKKLEEEARRVARPVPPKTVLSPSAHPATATQPAATQAPVTQQPSSSVAKNATPAQTAPASKGEDKKKGKQTKYQPIPMF